MPRYVIERRFDPIDDAEMAALTRRSKTVLAEQFPEITWEHSHVCTDADGRVTSFCVYAAPDEAALHRHAEIVGRHFISSLYEIIGDLDPAEIRT